MALRLPDPCLRCQHSKEAHAGDKDCMCGGCSWFVSPPTDAPLAAIASIQPGDRVLVLMAGDDVTPEQAQTMSDHLADRFPDVEFGFIAGAAGALVQRSSDE